jgi:phi13 family phage major tail protein
MANKVEFGLKNVYYALMTDEETPAYSTPVAIPGAVNFSPSPEGEQTKFYADDQVYYTTASNNGYAAEIEFAKLPDAALAALLGWEIDDDGIVEVSDAEPPAFALLCEFDGDAAGRRVAYYNCKASRSKEEHPTKGEKVEPATGSLTLAIMPIEIGDYMVVKKSMEYTAGGATVYNAWFDDVVLPAFTVS